MKCVEDGCETEASYSLPKYLCTWHRLLWLNYEDVKQTKKDLKEKEERR